MDEDQELSGELVEGEGYEINAPLVDVGPGYGEDVLRLAKSVRDTVEYIHEKAMQHKRGMGSDQTREIVRLMSRDVPEAFDDLGDAIEKAREVEQEIGKMQGGVLVDEEVEEDFLENYRKAEGVYRRLFMNRNVGGKPLAEYLEDEFYGSLPDQLPDVPDPRPGRRWE